MRRKQFKLFVILLFCFGFSGLQAQESVNTAGGNAVSSGGSVSYSVGQVNYQNNTGASGSVIEGVQQPYEIFVISGIDETEGIELSISAYPNPVAFYLKLSIREFDISDLSYQLFNMNGKLLQQMKITSNPESISTGNLIPATYFIKVFQKKRLVRTFKIIKH